MKTITMSDENYELLMSLTKELREQETDCQAAPRFWSPRSTRETVGTDDDTAYIYDDGKHDPRDYAEENPELWHQFTQSEGISSDLDNYDFNDSYYREQWIDYATDGDQAYKIYVRHEEVTESNPSFFKSDVVHFIEHNKHRLGENPHTYANTIFRMPKMESLMKVIAEFEPAPSLDADVQAHVVEDDDLQFGM